MKKGYINAIIPARGGSKGIFRKNVIDFLGKPLIAWTIEDALGSRYIDNVYVSTEDDEIASISEKYGATIISRPSKFADDLSSSESAIKHSLESMEISSISYIVFLQATSPLRESSDIDNAIEKIIREKSDSLLSVTLASDFFIWRENPNGVLASFNYDFTHRMRRQDFEKQFGKQYLENGSFYIFKPDGFQVHNNRLFGKISISIMETWKSFQIDNLSDLDLCETLFSAKLSKKL